MRWMYPVLFVCVASLLGCNPPAKDKPAEVPKNMEEEIKTAFTFLQAAIKAKDVDKIWSSLAKESQGDTEREAKLTQEAFGKLADKDKPDYEKKVGLSAKELTEMTGKLYVKSSTFFTGETAEMPDSKLDKVVMTGVSSAKVHYIEEDGKGQRETRSVMREYGEWKFVLPISKAVLK